MGFAQRLRDLMDREGLTNYQLSKDLDIHPTTVANWLSGKEPRKKTLKQLSDYFAVSLEYLLDEPDKKESAPILTKKDERDIEKRIAAVLADLESQQDGLAFSGEPLDDTTRELLAQSLRNSMELGKTIAKRKFTPKKYRKD